MSDCQSASRRDESRTTAVGHTVRELGSAGAAALVGDKAAEWAVRPLPAVAGPAGFSAR
ncbi:hypothetical protein [Streptomyces albipurpureus]|uniref:Uncharacterized protein n=1 Tax=Streptomyces albipurpureus TaxID=2897419 RepID=A0ABT0ULS6_9ACTN|nr:hypothetical protein [Streptomyces sp. CWNU-1]MCM2389572.1 hypothetical protein [Streptomyces sp. CWNU-1]